MSLPTIGRIVHYRINESDARTINKRRADFEKARRHNLIGGDILTPKDPGWQAHVGNDVREGDYYPAIVVRTFGGTAANLKVLLDGNDDYWATSRAEGEGPGSWAWPPRS